MAVYLDYIHDSCMGSNPSVLFIYLFIYLFLKLNVKKDFLCPRHFQLGGGWGEGAYSITAVRTSVRPVRITFGFRAISFGRIGVLD